MPKRNSKGKEKESFSDFLKEFREDRKERKEREKKRDKEQKKREKKRDKEQKEREIAILNQFTAMNKTMGDLGEAIANISNPQRSLSGNQSALPPQPPKTPNRTSMEPDAVETPSIGVCVQPHTGKYTNAEYRGYAIQLKGVLRVKSPLELFKIASPRLADAWINDDWEEVKDGLYKLFLDNYSKAKLEDPKEVYTQEIYVQQATRVMLQTIEEFENNRDPPSSLGLKSFDKSNNSMRGGEKRKPDFSLGLKGSSGEYWRNSIATFQLKATTTKHSDNVLRGQMVNDLLNMASCQPRRFMFTIGVAENRMVAYLYRDGSLHYCNIGPLPFVKDFSSKLKHRVISSSDSQSEMGNLKDEHKQVLRFTRFLLKSMDKDYGFVSQSSCGILTRTYPIDCTGKDPSDDYDKMNVIDVPDCFKDLESKGFWIECRTQLGGRVLRLDGSHTWLYNGNCGSTEMKPQQAIIKFARFKLNGYSEIKAHTKVLELGVPYIPKLHYAACMHGFKLPYELLVMEDSGDTVLEYVMDKGGGEVTPCKIIGIFAGVVHTLLAANSISEVLIVLHRDISAGNLLVFNGMPFVIDWGHGLIVAKEGLQERAVSPGGITGTTPYMSCRVLNSRETRSVFDDIVSVFLVYCHCLQLKYGSINESNSYFMAGMWDGKLNPPNLRMRREIWLGSKDSFWAGLNLSANCPTSLRTLAGKFYDLLYNPEDFGPHTKISLSPEDPRVSLRTFQDIVDVFNAAARDVGEGYKRDNIYCLGKLVKFVESLGDRNMASQVGVMPDKPKQILEEQKYGYEDVNVPRQQFGEGPSNYLGQPMEPELLGMPNRYDYIPSSPLAGKGEQGYRQLMDFISEGASSPLRSQSPSPSPIFQEQTKAEGKHINRRLQLASPLSLPAPGYLRSSKRFKSPKRFKSSKRFKSTKTTGTSERGGSK